MAKQMPAGLKKYLNSLHKAGRRAVKRSGIKVKPFYFSGKKKRKAKKRKVVSHKRITTAQEPIIFTKGKTMSRKRKTHKRRASRKASRKVTTYGRKVRRISRRRVRRYHGAGIGKLKPVAILTEVAGLAGGAIAGSFLAKVVPVANTKVKALIPILAGVVLGQMKFGRSGIGKDAAQGMIAIGSLSLARQFVPQIPVFAGVESAQELLTSIQGLPAEEQALLGFDGASELGGEEVLTGGMVDADLSPAAM